MAVRHIDYRSSAYNLASAGKEMREEKWSKQRVKDHCRSRGLDKEQTEIVLDGHKKSNEDRVDALVKDCDKLAARMDALNKRADACFTPKRADAGVKRVSKKARDQKIRDGVWEAVTDEKYGYQEIRDTRSGARFTIEVY